MLLPPVEDSGAATAVPLSPSLPFAAGAAALPTPTPNGTGGGAGGGSAIRVAVRVRPLPAGEHRIIEVIGDNAITVKKEAATGGNEFLSSQKGRTEERSFERVFGPLATQAEIYQWSCQSLVTTAVLQACNATIFVYGPTGAGKTHTMFGEQSDTEQGLIVRAVHEVFNLISGRSLPLNVKVSFLELYNEKIYDLLQESSNGGGTVCSILEDERRGILKISGLREVPVASAEEALHQLQVGTQLRKVESTAANARSSRSHAVFGLHLERGAGSSVAAASPSEQPDEVLPHVRVGQLHSKICLIDLAGSERASHTQNVGSALRDGAKINQSLLALANCINALGDRQGSDGFRDGTKTPQRKPPYRDSKLTLLLKSSLIGGGLVSMIACIHPGKDHFEDTCNTLEYAKRTSTVKSVVLVRREPSLPSRPPAAPTPSPPQTPPASGGDAAPVVQLDSVESDVAPRKPRRRSSGDGSGVRSSSRHGHRSNSGGGGSVPAGRGRRSRSAAGPGRSTPNAGTPNKGGGATPLRPASLEPPLGIPGCGSGTCHAAHDGAEASPGSPSTSALPPMGASRSGSPLGQGMWIDPEPPPPTADVRPLGQPSSVSSSDGFSSVPLGPLVRAAGMVRSASASGVNRRHERLPLAPSSPPLPSGGRPWRWAGGGDAVGLAPLPPRRPSPLSSGASPGALADQLAPASASREMLLRIVESVQAEKSALDAQLQAVTTDRDRLEAECRRLRAANLEKDHQLAMLLASAAKTTSPADMEENAPSN